MKTSVQNSKKYMYKQENSIIKLKTILGIIVAS